MLIDKATQFQEFVNKFLENSFTHKLAEKAEKFKEFNADFIRNSNKPDIITMKTSPALNNFIKEVIKESTIGEVELDKFNPLDFADWINDITYLCGETEFLNDLENVMRDLDHDGIKWVYLKINNKGV